jgi:hypothetical protein
MAAAQPIVGRDAVFVLTPIGGGSDIVLNNSDWDINPDPNVAEAPNTTDGMLRCVGLFDYKGTVKGNTDATSPTTAVESKAKAGAIYNFKAYRSKAALTYFAGTLILGPLKIGTGVSTVENWQFEFLKQSGVLTYPDGSTQ